MFIGYSFGQSVFSVFFFQVASLPLLHIPPPPLVPVISLSLFLSVIVLVLLVSLPCYGDNLFIVRFPLLVYPCFTDVPSHVGPQLTLLGTNQIKDSCSSMLFIIPSCYL